MTNSGCAVSGVFNVIFEDGGEAEGGGIINRLAPSGHPLKRRQNGFTRAKEARRAA